MKKMNNKGFTLIEMLVVIAIIAILVAIIIPTVMHATDKAAAATDAANLRSAKAVITTGMLDGTFNKGDDAITYDQVSVPQYSKSDKNDEFTGSIDDEGVVTVMYGSNDIDHYAGLAGDADEGGED